MSKNHDHTVALPRFLVVGPIWAGREQYAVLFKLGLKCKMILSMTGLMPLTGVVKIT